MTLSPPEISVDAISYERSGRIIIDELSFSVQQGQLLQVIGNNGAGKTTLLRLLTGILQPASGMIRWRGMPLVDRRIEYHQQLAYLGHELGLKNQLTVRENISLYWYQCRPASSVVEQVLKSLDLYQHRNRLLGDLSRGQRQRVALARLQLCNANCWILDEPFSSLDAVGQLAIETLFAEKVEENTTIIMTTHRPVELEGLVSESLCLAGEAVA